MEQMLLAYDFPEEAVLMLDKNTKIMVYSP